MEFLLQVIGAISFAVGLCFVGMSYYAWRDVVRYKTGSDIAFAMSIIGLCLVVFGINMFNSYHE